MSRGIACTLGVSAAAIVSLCCVFLCPYAPVILSTDLAAGVREGAGSGREHRPCYAAAPCVYCAHACILCSLPMVVLCSGAADSNILKPAAANGAKAAAQPATAASGGVHRKIVAEASDKYVIPTLSFHVDCVIRG